MRPLIRIAGSQKAVWRWVMWLSFVGFGVVLTACDRHEPTPAEHASPAESIVDMNVVEVALPLAYPLVKAETRTVPRELSVNGTIAPDVSRTVPVNALAGGRILKIHARLGDAVKKGQLLLEIQSPELASAIGDLKKAEADEQLEQRRYRRAKFLYEHGAIPQKDFEEAEDAWQKAQIDTATAKQQIVMLNGDLHLLQPLIEIRAPASGTIVEQNVTVGAAAKSLDNAPNLFTIADLSRVWLLCDVYENNLAQVKVGDFARVRLNADPDRVRGGRIGNISGLLDPGTRAAKVRIELDNPGGLLRPGMFATATFVSQTRTQQLVVPASAIFRLHDKDWVFVSLGGSMFRRTEIEGGAVNPDGSQLVVSGLQAGTLVASNALQLSEAAVAASPVPRPPATISSPRQ